MRVVGLSTFFQVPAFVQIIAIATAPVPLAVNIFSAEFLKRPENYATAVKASITAHSGTSSPVHCATVSDSTRSIRHGWSKKAIPEPEDRL